MDFDDASPAPWSARSQELGAEPVEPDRGLALLAKAWHSDRFIAALGPADLARLGTYLYFVRVPSDKEIIRQNEQGDFMAVVLEGTVSVDRIQAQGQRVRLAEAHPGEVVGDMAMLDAGARSSACSTLTPCTLAVIDARHLEEMAQSQPRLGLAVMAALSRRLSLRLRQVSARLSALLSGR